MEVLDILQFPIRGRQKRARRDREGVTKEAFVSALGQHDQTKKAASLLWDLLAEAAVVPDFRPLPDDKLRWMYGLAEEDLDEDIILRIFQELKLTVPSADAIEATGEIRTPRDVIKLVSHDASTENPD